MFIILSTYVQKIIKVYILFNISSISGNTYPAFFYVKNPPKSIILVKKRKKVPKILHIPFDNA